jgi:hypothetical protein
MKVIHLEDGSRKKRSKIITLIDYYSPTFEIKNRKVRKTVKTTSS